MSPVVANGVSYEEWVKGVPEEISQDVLWKVTAYRLALFLNDLAWADVSRLAQDRRTVGLSDQLFRAVGSIGANTAEGYSRGSAKDKARFYEYALGSARESRHWYWESRHVLSEPIASHRLRLLARIIQLLLVMLPDQRGYTVRETRVDYTAVGSSHHPAHLEPDTPDDTLLENAPLPSPVLTNDV